MIETNVIYIHYGSNKFDFNSFKPVRNGGILGKPLAQTGLWASRIDDNYGWKQWCEAEDFVECRKENSFCFTLAEDANVVVLTHPQQLEDFPRFDLPYLFQEDIDKFFPDNHVCLDFEAMASIGIDAIELRESYLFKEALWGWDCNCLFVMNPNVVKPVV